MTGRRGRRALTTVAWLVLPPLILAVLATLVLVALVALIDRDRSLVINIWLLTIGGLVVWSFWRALGAALPTAGRSAFDRVRATSLEKPAILPGVVDVEAAILDAEWSWNGLEHRLRPILRRAAAARLLEKHQIDLETEPDGARRALGEELWELIGPEPYGPPQAAADAGTPAADGADRPHGIPRATIKRAIDLLEAL
jgi:hypothetical protein